MPSSPDTGKAQFQHPKSRTKRIWFQLFWRADPWGLVLFYAILLTFFYISGLILDLLPYPDFVISISQATSFRTSPMVFEIWKWAYGIVGFALSIFSFSYSLVRDVSLSLKFTRNPIWRHLLATYLMTLVLGAFQNLRNTFSGQNDGLIGDYIFLIWILWLLVLAGRYVAEQFRRVAAPDEFASCQAQIERYLDPGIRRACQLAGENGVTEVVTLIETHLETMFQILGNFASKDTDVLYAECLAQLNLLSQTVVYALQSAEKEYGISVQYRKRIRFLSDKYCDHLLVVCSKNHGLEVRQVTDACVDLLAVAAVHDRQCLVYASPALQTVTLTLLQRKDRFTLLTILGKFEQLYRPFKTLEFGAALVYIYESILVEAGVDGDKSLIHEILQRMSYLEKDLPPMQIKGFYSVLWVSALKTVEHSSHASTGAFIKTFVSTFNQFEAAKALQLFISKFVDSKNIPSVRVPAGPELSRDADLRETLSAINPRFDLMQGTLGYCLEKLLFLWFGQQRYMISLGISPLKKPAVPRNLGELEGRYWPYFQEKLPYDAYGLNWLRDGVPDTGADLHEAGQKTKARVASDPKQKSRSDPFEDENADS